MKSAFNINKIILALAVVLTSLSQFAIAEPLTKVQALKVLNVLMSAKKITDTYGGRYSAITVDARDSELIIQRVRGTDLVEIQIEQHAPGIDIKNIMVDGRALNSYLR